MSVCPHCGVSVEDFIEVCAHCGADCGADPNIPGRNRSTDSPATVPTRPKTSEANWAVQSAARGGDSLSYQQDNNESDTFNRLDSHLGKGTITPQAVEQGIDGYHFKYDEPLRSVTKAEPVKDKTIEYRVTELDMNPSKETESVFKRGQAPVNSSAEKSETENNPLETVTVFGKEESLAGPAPETPETPNEALDAISDLKPDTSGEEVIQETVSKVQDAAPDMTKVIQEPPSFDDTELPVVEPVENVPVDSPPASRVIWEGKGHIFSIPFGPFYQITDQAIRIAGETEYPLSKITRLDVKQNWLSRLSGNGDLIVTVRGSAGEVEIYLRAIPNPQKILRLIADLNGSGYNVKYG